MNSSRAGDSLSVRLKTLSSFHTTQKHIWDIGCDHGHLGLSFATNSFVASIHLVDPAKPVIETLFKKLKDSYITKENIFVHHQQGQDLKLDSKNNCIFIAGMGGNEIGEIIKNLLPQLDAHSQIVISPHRKILELRGLLNSLPIELICESVMWEEGHFYPMLCLALPSKGKKVSLYGVDLWQGEVGEAYRSHQVKYFSSHMDEASKSYVKYLKGLSP
jgi:tRNA (adenine22-N1)-methyltransferase